MTRLLAFLALLLGLLSCPATASSREAPPDPATFPTGDAPAVTWQSGTTVHTAAGRTIELPIRADASVVRVLGRRHGEWIVVIEGGEPRVVGVKGHRVRQIWSHGYDESATYYDLARGGDFVLEENYTRGNTVFFTALDLQGHEIDTRSFNAAYVIGVEGDEVFFSRRRQSFSWVPGEKPVVVGPAAGLADRRRDLLFVDDAATETRGPTALSAPGTPRWLADLNPVVLSRDGGWIAADNFVGRSFRLQVRSMADGSLTDVPDLKVESDAAMTWEPDGALLVEVEGRSGHALVRCTVTGRCERATPWVKGQVLSFPS